MSEWSTSTVTTAPSYGFKFRPLKTVHYRIPIIATRERRCLSAYKMHIATNVFKATDNHISCMGQTVLDNVMRYCSPLGLM